MPLSAGTMLGPYEILARIGAGGMGEVYKATDTRLRREVAIKVAGGLHSLCMGTPKTQSEHAAILKLFSCTLTVAGRQERTDVSRLPTRKLRSLIMPAISSDGAWSPFWRHGSRQEIRGRSTESSAQNKSARGAGLTPETAIVSRPDWPSRGSSWRPNGPVLLLHHCRSGNVCRPRFANLLPFFQTPE